MQDPTNDEQRLNICKTAVARIYTMLRTSPHEWRRYLTLARSVVAHINNTTFMDQPNMANEQTWIIIAIQRLAFADADHGAVPDLDLWVSQQWLAILHRDEHNVTALRAI